MNFSGGENGYKIPKKTLFNPDPDSSSKGENLPLNLCKKFSNVNRCKVDVYLKKDNLLPVDMSALCSKFENLILHSVTNKTWSKHSSAWNMFSTFCKQFDREFELPIDMKTIRAFAAWSLTVKKLKPETVKTYISSISLAHQLGGVQCDQFLKDKSLQMALKGGSNLEGSRKTSTPLRCPFNVHLLKILGHRIAAEDWDPLAKCVLWGACTTGFFTSCRMGEILASHENNFDSSTTLLWKHAYFLENGEIMLSVPYAKSTGFKGAFLYVFPIPNDSICPATALYDLKALTICNKLFNSNSPVFQFKSGKLLTTSKVNEMLKFLLADFMDSTISFTCHSFRSALPSAFATLKKGVSNDDLKDWGNWNSDCYKKYTKRERDSKRAMFSRIINHL